VIHIQAIELAKNRLERQDMALQAEVMQLRAYVHVDTLMSELIRIARTLIWCTRSLKYPALQKDPSLVSFWRTFTCPQSGFDLLSLRTITITTTFINLASSIHPSIHPCALIHQY